MKTKDSLGSAWIAVLFGVGLASLSALGDQVYSSGAPQLAPPDSLLGPNAGYSLGTVIVRQNFALTNASRLTSADVYTVDTADGEAGIFEYVQYWFYSGASSPTTLIATGFGENLSFKRVATYPVDNDTDDVYLQSFDLEKSVYLSGGVNYWFVWAAQIDPSGPNDEAWWDPVAGDTGAPGTISYAFDFFGTAATNTSSSFALQRRADGSLVLQAQGPPGECFQIQASQDLQTWVNLGSAVAGTNGLAQFIDPNAANYSARFYAAKPQ